MARKIGSRTTNTTILLIVEGETEQIYFSQMKSYERLRTVTIKPKLAKYSNPVQILGEALKASSEQVYDFIWCIFDRDVLNYPSKRFEQLYKQVRKKHIMFAESFPCFEIWFLIHFALPSSACQTLEGLLKELKKYIADYCKETNWLQKDKNVKAGQDKLVPLPKRQFLPAETKAERHLIRLMFEYNEIIPYCAAQLELEEIKGKARQEIINFIFNVYNMKGAVSAALWRESPASLNQEAENELAEIMLAEISPGAENFSQASEDLSRIVDDCIKAVKLAHLKAKYENHRLLASEMERDGNSNLLQELAEMQRIKNKIKNLYEN